MEIISAWQIYLFGIIPAIHGLIEGMICISALALAPLGGAFMFNLLENSSAASPIIKKLRFVPVLLLVSVVLKAVIPSQATVAAMYILPPIVNNSEVQQGGREIVKAGKDAVVSTLNLPPLIEEFVRNYIRVEDKKDK